MREEELLIKLGEITNDYLKKFGCLYTQIVGALIALSDNSLKEEERLILFNGGLQAAQLLLSDGVENNFFKSQGRVNSRKSRESSTPSQRAETVAQEMMKKGRSPQEIGLVTSRILGFRG